MLLLAGPTQAKRQAIEVRRGQSRPVSTVTAHLLSIGTIAVHWVLLMLNTELFTARLRQPDLPDLPLSKARNVASYTLFLTNMDSRSSRAMVVI